MRRNIVANLFGKFWSIFSNFIFIPLYIKYLGFESYSIISFSLLITGVMAILDGGLTATLSREFSRRDYTDEYKFRIFRSLETVYLFLAFLCIIIVFFSSDYISQHWINVKIIKQYELSSFFKIISFDIGFQLLLRFYIGGFIGLEKQVQANIYQIFWGVFRNGLVILVVFFLPNLYAFFLWQTVSTILFTLLIKFALQKNISVVKKININFKIEKEILQKVGRFAGGMMLITLVSAINTQLDKLTISKLLSIESLGYYTIAVSLSQGLIILINPITTALLPRLTSYYSNNEVKKASLLYGKFSLFVSILSFSIIVNIYLFSKDLVWIWTSNKEIAENTYKLVPIIAFSYGMMSIAMLPYSIAIANGNTKINNFIGFFSLLITIPGYIYFSKKNGTIGVAIVFCFVQTVTTIIYTYIINAKFLKMNFLIDILLKQILLPFLIVVIVAFGFHILPNYFKENRMLDLIWIGLSTLVTIFITTIVFVPIAELKSNLPSLKLKKNGE
ncbi:hypothetical protein BWK59_01245 [Flavobacterium davisii]|uniref:Polysaccharide biosynthesis protein n=1 Tax=Flavobacterium davisii TaxID=2906077 RepID=A0A2D0AIX3_9FLAO|nr:oligosaccharide flippase family protein [Flavobacterium davisii]OWP85196.1 hypothetical protein BWK59_01245 [Flavobacterium davisii]